MKIGGKLNSNFFEPLYEHLCKGRHCSNLICSLVDAFANDNKKSMQVLCDEISETESQADTIKFAVRAGLTKSIFATIKRDNVLQIIRNQDKICGLAEDAAKLMIVRSTALPKGCYETLKSLSQKVDLTVESLLFCCERLAVAQNENIHGRNKNTYSIEAILNDLNHIHEQENETDTLVHSFTKELLAQENESDPLSIMLLFEMARLISGMADKAENAAEVYITLLRG